MCEFLWLCNKPSQRENVYIFMFFWQVPYIWILVCSQFLLLQTVLQWITLYTCNFIHMIIPRSEVADQRVAVLAILVGGDVAKVSGEHGRGSQLLGLITLHRVTTMTLACLRETSFILVLYLLCCSQRRDSVTLPPWKSWYNSPSEDLQVPLWGWGEWLFYSFPGTGGRIL